MVWKVKQLLIMFAAVTLVAATCGRASAASYEAYEGTPSNTYITYFRDIVSGIGLGDHYVAFRSGQYEYTMVVGDLSYNASSFSCTTMCTVYTFQNDNTYGGYYSYTVSEIDSFSFSPGDKLVYSDLGQYPQLEERGQKYEILTAISIVAVCVGYVVKSIFYRKC